MRAQTVKNYDGNDHTPLHKQNSQGCEHSSKLFVKTSHRIIAKVAFGELGFCIHKLFQRGMEADDEL